MSSWLLVIPSINSEWSQQCLDSLVDNKTDFKYIVVDNTVKNHGVAGAWNIGVDRVIEDNIDWLVICSESVRFGPDGASNIQEALDGALENDMLVEAGNGLGWHLIAMRKELFLAVGYFDEIFWPAYFEDNDYSYRIKMISDKLNKPWFPWKKFELDASLIGIAQGLKFLNYEMDFGWLKEKYEEKWGGSPIETYEHPYNNPDYSLRYAERHNR